MNRETKIKRILAQHPEGISFNALHREVKAVCSIQTLVNILRDLQEEGLVTREPPEEETRKGERVFYKSTTALQEFEGDIEKILTLYDHFRYKLVLSEYFAERAPSLQFLPEAMTDLFLELDSILTSGLCVSAKFQEKTRHEFQDIITASFLEAKLLYTQFLGKHPEFFAKMLKEIREEVEKIRRRPKEEKKMIAELLSQEGRQKTIKDFSDWIEGKNIENKADIKKYFELWILV